MTRTQVKRVKMVMAFSMHYERKMPEGVRRHSHSFELERTKDKVKV